MAKAAKPGPAAVAAKKTRPDEASVDATLADDLVALIGRSLKDPEVKAVLTRAVMLIGKKADQQANPSLGVAYMGAKIDIDGKRQLGVDAIFFFASKQRSFIRGIGADVEFEGYPGPLPMKLELGERRASVAKKLGKPRKTYADCDYWDLSTTLKATCTFKRGKLVEVYFGQPKSH